MTNLDPLPDFSPPRTLNDKPCLTAGNTYANKCYPHCQYRAHDGTLKPGCIFYPRSDASGLTRTKEAYTKYDKPKAERTGESLPGYQVWQIVDDS